MQVTSGRTFIIPSLYGAHLKCTKPTYQDLSTMALKDRFRRALSRRDSLSSSPSSLSSLPNNDFTTPALSQTPSAEKLPNLVPSPTTQSKQSLKLTKSTSSGFSLSRFRSNKSQFEIYAPKNYQFLAADPTKVATLNAWNWNYGTVRGSFSSTCSGVCPKSPA